MIVHRLHGLTQIIFFNIKKEFVHRLYWFSQINKFKDYPDYFFPFILTYILIADSLAQQLWVKTFQG